ncbi:MAG TPA: winged helix DNA-binding domain-containing protein [Ilumatobacteraceae bacterium]|nr:winged helix DNA-binding domain-containing protein [Ilumatobacteraceae bacterium]
MSAELPVVTNRQLQRAVLARQLLLERASTSVPDALERVAGLQSQYAPTMYVGLWSRLRAFARDDLTRALERRSVVQGTMMRSTIHLVSATDYWPLNLAIRDRRRSWWLRLPSTTHSDDEMQRAAERLRIRLASDGPLGAADLATVVGPEANGVGLWLDLVRVPPSGTWERRRADLYEAAAHWIGPAPDMTTAEAVDHLVRRYLTGFGPATVNEIASWAGLTAREIAPAADRVAEREFRSEDGKRLVDLADQPLPAPDTPAPPRFLSTWEAILLVHARRAGVIREEDRPRIFSTKLPQSLNTFLVDGEVTGTWRHEGGRIEVSPWRRVSRVTAAELRDEADRLRVLYA